MLLFRINDNEAVRGFAAISSTLFVVEVFDGGGGDGDTAEDGGGAGDAFSLLTLGAADASVVR